MNSHGNFREGVISTVLAMHVSLEHISEGQDVLTKERWVIETEIWDSAVQAVQDMGCLRVR